MNLRVSTNLNTILDILGVDRTTADGAQLVTDLTNVLAVTYAANDTGAVRLAIKAVWESSAAKPDGRLEFKLTDTEIRTAYDTIIKGYEGKVDALTSLNPPQSFERVALVSLAFNGFPWSQSVMLRAEGLENDDSVLGRAIAWWEIAYNTNGDVDNGIAKRRYVEGEVVNLYGDVEKADLADVTKILQFLRGDTDFRGGKDILQDIDGYESTED